MTVRKRLTRSQSDRMIAGVCGGLGDYLAVDATALRLAFVALTVLTGFVPGILIYVVAIFLVPAEEGPGPRVRDADAGHATWRESGRW